MAKKLVCREYGEITGLAKHAEIGGCVLEAHHIKAFLKHKEIRLNMENGVTLCYECHKLIHKKI